MKKLILILTVLFISTIAIAQELDKKTKVEKSYYYTYSGVFHGNLFDNNLLGLRSVDNFGLTVLGGKYTLDLAGTTINSYLNLFDDGTTSQILVGGGVGVIPVWGANLPTAVTIGSKYIYRVDGTDVPDADVENDITINSSNEITALSYRGVLNASDGTPDSVLVIDANGNVGILRGTISPTVSRLLDVINLDAASEVRIMGGTGNWGATLNLTADGADDVDDVWTIVNVGAGRLLFRNNDVSMMEFLAAETVVNQTGIDRDFRIETDNEDSAFVVDGATGIASYEAGINTAKINFFADAQGSDSYVVTLPGVKLTVGIVVYFTANTVNTDGATLALNGYATAAILKLHDQALITNDIEAGQFVQVGWDGSNWQMLSPVAN